VDASGQPRRVIFHLADATVPACLRTARVAWAGRPADVHSHQKLSGITRGHRGPGRSVDVFYAASCSAMRERPLLSDLRCVVYRSAGRSSPWTSLGLLIASIRATAPEPPTAPSFAPSQSCWLAFATKPPLGLLAQSRLHAVDHDRADANGARAPSKRETCSLGWSIGHCHLPCPNSGETRPSPAKRHPKSTVHGWRDNQVVG